MTLTNGEDAASGAISFSGSSTDLTLNHVAITNNSNSIFGAVISGSFNSAASSLTLNNSVISNNSGAAITTYAANFNLNNSTISGNTGKSTISLFGSESVNIFNSTISGNIDDLNTLNSPTNGGAILAISISDRMSLSILQSTLSGNSTANGNGGAISLSGDIDLDIIQSTITNNTALSGSAITLDTMTNNPTSINLNIRNSIISGNFDTSVSTKNEVFIPTGSTYSQVNSNNIFGYTVGLSGTDNVFIESPKLGPLANNGGPTKTHLPLPESLAIDNAEGSILFFLENDQRGQGYPRFSPDSLAVDIGAR